MWREGIRWVRRSRRGVIVRQLYIRLILRDSCVGRGRPWGWECVYRVLVVEAELVVGWCGLGRWRCWAPHVCICGCCDKNVAIHLQSSYRFYGSCSYLCFQAVRANWTPDQVARRMWLPRQPVQPRRRSHRIRRIAHFQGMDG